MIGIPNVLQYGSSHGSFGGVRLSDYKNPDPDTTKLNNVLSLDTGEFNTFERTIKDFILAKLGAPTIRVELTNTQIKICIEEAMSKLEYHAPEWMTQFAVFDASAGINVYELPPAVVNNLTDVWYKRNLFSLGVNQDSLEFNFVWMFFNNTGLFNNYNVSQYLQMQMYLKQMKRVLGLAGTWSVVNNKYIQLYPVPAETEPVILEFRAINPDTIHPAYKSWIQRYSLCLAKEILGRVRSKYETVPGPGGGARLDGIALLSEAREEKALLLEELQTEIEGPPLFDIT
jgi:hypothetical protein